MTDSYVRGDEGQALVIVAFAMIVLVGALALATDWGYGYTTRRAVQNAADSATLAVGRHVASTFTTAGDFEATVEDVCNDVGVRTAQVGGPVTVSFFSEATAGDPALWTTISTANCASGSSIPVPADTVFVRVSVSKTYTSLFNIVTRQPLVVAASARARITGSAASGCPGTNRDCAGLRPLSLPQSEIPGPGVSGATTAPNVAIWPLTMHLDLRDFDGSGGRCGQYCDVTTRTPITLYPSDSYGPSGQIFRGLLSFAHFSLREPGDTHQLTTESDYTGTADSGISTAHNHLPIPGKTANADPRACGGAPLWDTLGNWNSGATAPATCDLPNWFAYGFRGSIGVATDWSDTSWQGFESSPGTVDLPEPLPTRATCDRSVSLPRPSCDDPALGDWVETVWAPLDTVMADQMLAFVAQYGRDVPNSAASCGARVCGKAVVVHIPLWDCAEHFDASQPVGSATRWDLIAKNRGGDPTDDADCSKLNRIRDTTVDRVHIAAVVPFTIFEGLIDRTAPRVSGYWGDIFGDPGICAETPPPAGCDLNPFMNSAFLVPDE